MSWRTERWRDAQRMELLDEHCRFNLLLKRGVRETDAKRLKSDEAKRVRVEYPVIVLGRNGAIVVMLRGLIVIMPESFNRSVVLGCGMNRQGVDRCKSAVRQVMRMGRLRRRSARPDEGCDHKGGNDLTHGGHRRKLYDQRFLRRECSATSSKPARQRKRKTVRLR